MTKTERNKLRKEEKEKGTGLVMIRLYNPIIGRNTWMIKRVKVENVRAS